MRRSITGFVSTVIVLVVFSFGYSAWVSTRVEVTTGHKVIKTYVQNTVSGSEGNLTTKVRYLVITDKETFVCENSVMNLKFNNSDIFFRIKQDSVYNFRVVGVGKILFTEYRNILEIVQ